MKKVWLSLALVFLLALPALAQADDSNRGGGFTASGSAPAPGGGYTGPAPGPITVAEALKLRDDAWVTLAGRIEKQIGGEKYQFRDGTGQVVVEIDDDKWGGLTVGPEDAVEITGELDKDWAEIEIDVQRIVKK